MENFGANKPKGLGLGTAQRLHYLVVERKFHLKNSRVKIGNHQEFLEKEKLDETTSLGQGAE